MSNKKHAYNQIGGFLIVLIPEDCFKDHEQAIQFYTYFITSQAPSETKTTINCI